MGMVIFCIVAIPAVLLGEAVKLLEREGASPYVLSILTGAEYIVFTADVALYLFLLGKSLYKAAKELEL